MGQKWNRAKAWDERHLRGALWPIKVLLGLFSSVSLAATLVAMIAGYGLLAWTTPLLRLPSMEMSEAEYFAWWPLRLLLILLTVNVVVLIVRRFDHGLPFKAVIVIHSIIVLIALGSMVHERQMRSTAAAFAGAEAAAESRKAGEIDDSAPALWLTQDPTHASWEVRPLIGLPRYNDYNLDVVGGALPDAQVTGVLDHGPLSLPVPAPDVTGEGAEARPRPVDADLWFRVVGYAASSELAMQWLPGDGSADQGAAVRTIEAYLNLPPDPNDPESGDPNKPRATWRLTPDRPTRRVEVLSVQGTDLLGIEYCRGMSAQRWKDLAASIPPGTQYALVVRHPASSFETVYPAQQGSTITVGSTGFVLEVLQIEAKVPFPIITKGYQGAQSSMAVVQVKPPVKGVEAKAAEYQRWVYHRFPEISQDLLSGPMPPGVSPRRIADPELEIALVDASMLQVYFDERSDGTVRALVRMPGGQATVTPSIVEGGSVQVAPGFTFKLAGRAGNMVQVERPSPASGLRGDSRFSGGRDRAAVAVQVGAEKGMEVVWLPFAKFAQAEIDKQRHITLADGRQLTLVFSRTQPQRSPRGGIWLAVVLLPWVLYLEPLRARRRSGGADQRP